MLGGMDDSVLILICFLDWLIQQVGSEVGAVPQLKSWPRLSFKRNRLPVFAGKRFSRFTWVRKGTLAVSGRRQGASKQAKKKTGCGQLWRCCLTRKAALRGWGRSRVYLVVALVCFWSSDSRTGSAVVASRWTSFYGVKLGSSLGCFRILVMKKRGIRHVIGLTIPLRLCCPLPCLLVYY